MFGNKNHKDEWTGFLTCNTLIYNANKKLKAKIKKEVKKFDTED